MADGKELDSMVQYVSDEFVRYENYHKSRFDLDKKVYDLWSNKPPKRAQDWQNAVNVPLMVEAEQTITPRLFTALFPTDAPIDVLVEGDTEPSKGVRIKSIIQHYFRVANAQGEALPMLTQTTLFGTGYLEGGSWYIRKGFQFDQIGNRYYTLIESRPDVSPVDYFEMFPHPAKLRMNDNLPIIRRRFIDAETLKNLANDNRFLGDKLKEALDSKPTEVIATDKYDGSKNEHPYEILEYWGPWDEEIQGKDGEQKPRKAVPYWIIVVNRKVKIRGIPNPFNHQQPPYIKIKLFEDPKPSWFGVGVGQVGKPTQDRINKLVNQRLDNVDLVLNKQGFYNGNDNLINTKRLQVSKPGLWHKVSDTVTSIRWMDIPDVTRSSYEEEKLAKQDFREATGAVTNLMPGEKEDQHRTAMGIQLLQGAAGMRFRPVLRKMEIEFIQQLAMFFFSNLKQFMTEPEWVMITGENGKKEPIRISPQEIQAKVFFVPTGISETMNKEVQVGQLLRFKEITMNDPTVNRQEINKRVAELMGFKDIDKLLTPIQPNVQPGGLSGQEQQIIQQRLAEGASPEQIKQEMLGVPPAQEGAPSGGQ